MLRGSLREQIDRIRERQRLDRTHRLAVNSQRHLTRTQHAQARRRMKKPRDEIGDGIDNVFAVVEDEQRVGAMKTAEQHRLGPTRDVERGRDRFGHRPAGACRFQAGQPGAGAAVDSSGGFDRQPRLAHAGRADQCDEPFASDAPNDLVEFVTTADQCR